MKIAYVEKLRLSRENKRQLAVINAIVEEYQAEGYTLTLRQLYYQLVSRDVIPNKDSEYKKLGTLLTKGRMAGVVDWDAIEDRVRVPDKAPSWESPKEIIKSAADQYRRNRMEGQDIHIEVWVEKDALSGVLKRISREYGVHLMVNRGYSSTSAMHDSFQRFKQAWLEGQKVVILYLGDHDPSGIDMIRDIRERIEIFVQGDEVLDELENFGWLDDKSYVIVDRIALTKQQIDQYNPPPNPAKVTDPRAGWYIQEHGRVSWEVDALKPQVLLDIVENSISQLIDDDLYYLQIERENNEKKRLKKVAKEWKDEDDEE